MIASAFHLAYAVGVYRAVHRRRIRRKNRLVALALLWAPVAVAAPLFVAGFPPPLAFEKSMAEGFALFALGSMILAYEVALSVALLLECVVGKVIPLSWMSISLPEE